MANNYFKFKQFTVHQDLAAMKVGTDGVLLGAWVSTQNVQSILDIGTGTGLIALMLAQRTENAFIDAIELDANACKQANLNFNQSEWSKRLNAIEANFQSFNPGIKYDLIISNPPYFNNSLKNECEKKSKARHTDSLSFKELICGAAKLLNTNGRFCVVLPANERCNFELMANQNNLFLNRLLNVKPTPAKPPKRVLMEFSWSNKTKLEEDLVVEEFGRHQFSEKYKKLTKDFYLAF